MWSLISTGWPGCMPVAQPAAAVGQHDGLAAGGDGGAHAVRRRRRRRGPRRGGCGRGRPARACRRSAYERILPAWPSTAGGGKPGSSVTGNSASGAPSASAAGAQPEPITRATSWVSAPVSSRSARRRRRRRREGSVTVAFTRTSVAAALPTRVDGAAHGVRIVVLSFPPNRLRRRLAERVRGRVESSALDRRGAVHARAPLRRAGCARCRPPRLAVAGPEVTVRRLGAAPTSRDDQLAGRSGDRAAQQGRLRRSIT